MAETVRERPILFSAEMVRALLDGTKTQTRRVIARQPGIVSDPEASNYGQLLWPKGERGLDGLRYMSWSPDANPCPFGMPGDRLWVRETWCPLRASDYAPAPRKVRIGERNPNTAIAYRADHVTPSGDAGPLEWRPSIHMPRWCSRITLEITEVRSQRLRSISEDDARAEGVTLGEQVPATINGESGTVAFFDGRAAYAYLWDRINGKRPGCAWKDDPWVWCVSFKRVEVANV